jgi:hypothetical protein
MSGENDVLAQLRRAAEQLAHVDRAFNQFDQHYGASVRRATEQWRSYESDIIAQAQRAAQRLHREIGDQARHTLVAQLRQFETRVFEPVRVLGRDLERHADWKSLLQQAQGIGPHLPLPKITSDIVAQAEAARDASIKAILEQSSKAGVWATDPWLGTRMHAIPAAYVSFCEATIKELANGRNRSLANQLLGSIKLAQAHVQEVSSIPPMPVGDVAVHGGITHPAAIRVYAVQRAELSTVDISDPQDADELRAKSPTAVGASRVSQMLKLVPEVNTAAKLSGATEIFRPTDRVLLAFAELPGIVTSNQTSFADFIDRLFWVFYEGAGRDSLRFLTKNGGPLDDADCDAIWAIKTLRNKWYRHDPDHGSPADIRSSYKALSKTLHRFGLKTLPDSAKDYRRIHIQLIEDLVLFLQKLRDRLA